MRWYLPICVCIGSCACVCVRACVQCVRVCMCVLGVFWIGSGQVAQADLKLVTLSRQPPLCWDYRSTWPCSSFEFFWRVIVNMYLLDIFVCSSKKAQFGSCFLAGFFLAPELHSWLLVSSQMYGLKYSLLVCHLSFHCHFLCSVKLFSELLLCSSWWRRILAV